MPDERVIELCRLWWESAREDLQAAERLSDLPFTCCFHCQQAVEKAIKCLLILNQVEFAKSHDIGMLLNLLKTAPIAPDESATEEIETLTRFAVDTRYPPESATPEEAEEALRLAREFIQAIRVILPSGVISGHPDTLPEPEQ